MSPLIKLVRLRAYTFVQPYFVRFLGVVLIFILFLHKQTTELARHERGIPDYDVGGKPVWWFRGLDRAVRCRMPQSPKRVLWIYSQVFLYLFSYIYWEVWYETYWRYLWRGSSEVIAPRMSNVHFLSLFYCDIKPHERRQHVRWLRCIVPRFIVAPLNSRQAWCPFAWQQRLDHRSELSWVVLTETMTCLN